MPSLINVFKIQIGIDLGAKVISTRAPTTKIELVATMPFKSAKYQGTIAILFPKDTFLRITNQMLGEQQVEILDENADAASELLNIVYASARSLMNRLGNDFAPALPTVLRGKDLNVLHGSSSALYSIVAEGVGEAFYIEMSLRQI